MSGVSGSRPIPLPGQVNIHHEPEVGESSRSRAQSLTTDVGRSRAQSLRPDPGRQVSSEARLRHTVSDTVGGAEKWRARNWRQEKIEMGVGGTAAGVGFTRFLSGAGHAFKVGAQVGTALPIVGTVFAGGDVLVSAYSMKKTYDRRGAWKELAGVGTPEGGKRLQDQLKALRGKGNQEALKETGDASVKFALDPTGTTNGKSRLSGLSKEQQLDQLSRIGSYAADKAQRKMGRKGVEGTLGSLAFGFGVASLASGVITPPGLLFGALSMGFGIARGACKVAAWCKAAYKGFKGTLGQARERNANALLELATNPSSQVQKEARATLAKLGIDEAKLNGMKDSAARKKVLVDVMTAMRS